MKDTCKYIKQKWKEKRAIEWTRGERADPSGEDSEREGDKERSED